MAAKKNPSKESVDKVQLAINKINRDAKHTVVARADQVPYLYHLRRPSGIMQLDLDTGGGLPAGSVCCLSGPDGVGKSDFLYRYLAWQQRIFGEECCLALAHVEHQFDHFRLRRLGVKIPIPMDHIHQEQQDRKHRGVPLLTKPEIADLQTGVGRFFLIPPADMESMLGTVLDLLASGGFHMIGIDSVSAMIPKDMDNKDLDDEAKRGAHAMCMKRFYLKYYNIGGIDNPIWTSLVMTQQVAANDAKSTAPAYISKWMPDFAVKGGFAAKHGKVIDILLTNGPPIKEIDEDKAVEGKENKNKKVTGKSVRWELIKGKAGTHEGKKGEVDFDFDAPNSINYAQTVFAAGTKLGILEFREGLVTWLHNGQPHHEVKRIPYQLFIDALNKHPQLDFDIRRDILAAAGIDCRYHDA